MTFSRDYPINLVLIDVNQRLSLTGLLRILQDMAFQHAEELGHGFFDCAAKNEFWVFTQQSLRIRSMPAWNDVLTVETWVCDIGSLTAVREFALSINGERIGECAMQCMLLDQTTHRPKRLKQVSDSLNARTSQLPELRPEKIAVPDEVQQLGSHTVAISDLDLNQHVNNTKYVQWMLDALPLSVHTDHHILNYEVNFLAETFLGDSIDILSDYPAQQSQLEGESEQATSITFTGEREADGKRVFSARLSFS